jgi:hypothetical protein
LPSAIYIVFSCCLAQAGLPENNTHLWAGIVSIGGERGMMGMIPKERAAINGKTAKCWRIFCLFLFLRFLLIRQGGWQSCGIKKAPYGAVFSLISGERGIRTMLYVIMISMVVGILI